MIRAELKNTAKDKIKGNIGMFFLCMLIVIALSTVLGLLGPIGGLVDSFLVLPPLILGFTKLALGMIHGEKVTVSKLFHGFNDFGRAALLNLFMSIFIFLWSLLLIIPGIIKSLSYSMSFYILAENPDMEPMDAINESKRIMDGHKWELFVLMLSFILWDLLSGITCGIAYIYVAPYKSVTFAEYYYYVKSESSNEVIEEN